MYLPPVFGGFFVGVFNSLKLTSKRVDLNANLQEKPKCTHSGGVGRYQNVNLQIINSAQGILGGGGHSRQDRQTILFLP